MAAKIVLGPDIVFVDVDRVDLHDFDGPDHLIRLVRCHGDPREAITSLRGLQSKANPWLIPTAFLLGFLAAVICFKVL